MCCHLSYVIFHMACLSMADHILTERYNSLYPTLIYTAYIPPFIKLLCSLSGEGNGTPLQYSCLENPMDRGAW